MIGGATTRGHGSVGLADFPQPCGNCEVRSTGEVPVVPRSDELLARVLRGDCDASISFMPLRSLLLRLGFVERINGGHHIFQRPGVPGILTLQRKGHEGKRYQVRQVRKLLLRQGFRSDA